MWIQNLLITAGVILLFFAAIIVIVALPFVISAVYWYIHLRYVEKIEPKECEPRKFSYGSKLKRLVVDFPRQYMLDRLNFDPDRFPEKGVHIIEGEQGDGKTLTVCFLLRMYQKLYPKLVVKTNFEYKYQDGVIEHLGDVMGSKNGIYGEIHVLDEIQNTFNSLQSKNFPPEMMNEITQCRKQVKMIIGTSQVFTRVAKPIREQTYVLYSPITIAGCLTIVRKYKPQLNEDGGVENRALLGIFFYVHSKELRESYDTYKKIERMAMTGFKSETERIR
jgi:ATP-dependent Clp protease ATP-binding subunit ClpX